MDELAPVRFVLLPDPPEDRPIIVSLLGEVIGSSMTIVFLGLGGTAEHPVLECRGALQHGTRQPGDEAPPIDWWEVLPGQLQLGSLG